MQQNFASPVMISLDGYSTGEYPISAQEDTKGESVIYKIPPVFWMFLFLLVGYAGMRYVMED